MKLKTLTPRRRLNTAASFAALLATAVMPISSLLAANSELDVPSTATTLNGVPTVGPTKDLTFTSGTTYTATINSTASTTGTGSPIGPVGFSTTTLTIGTINDLDNTQTLTVVPSGTSTLTLAGGGDTVAGSSSSDLIYVAPGAVLSFASNGLTVNQGAAGNFDVATTGTLNFGLAFYPYNAPSSGAVIAGSNGLTKTGGGLMQATGNNTFTGNLLVSGGTLTLGGNNVFLGTTTVTGSSSVLTLGGTNIYTGGTVIDNGGSLTINSDASLGAVPATATTNISFTGTGGTLRLNAASALLPGLTVSPSPFSLNVNRNINIATGATAIFDTNTLNLGISSLISGGGALTKNGAGTLTLSAANTFGGGQNVTLNTGTLNINNALALGDASNTFVITGGTFNNTTGSALMTANYTQTWSGDFTFAGTSSMDFGTGAITLMGNRAVTVLANTLTEGGVISGSGASLTKAGAGQLTLTGASTYSGGTALNAGVLNINNGGTATSSAIGTGTFTIVGGTFDNTSGAALTLGTNNAQVWNGDFTFGGTSNLNLGTGAVSLGTLTGATRTVTVAANTLLVGGIIANGTAATTPTINLTKVGVGTLALYGQSTYTGTTSVNNGTLLLDFADSASTSALLNAASPVALGNGTLAVSGQNGVSTTQSFSSTLTLNPGNSAIQVVPGTTAGSATSLVLGNTTLTAGALLTVGNTSANAGTANITLGTISRNAGSGLATFVLPTTGTIATRQANGATSILGSYATVGGTTWAVSAGTGSANPAGAITALPEASYTADTWAAANNVTVTADSTQAANATANSVRFNTAGPATVTLSGTANVIASGGILETANVGANNETITGGSLTTNATPNRDFVVTQNNTLGLLTIGSNLVNNGASAVTLTKAGPGTLALTGTNTYSGGTYIYGGTLNINADAALGTTTVNFEAPSTLQLASMAGTVTGTRNFALVTLLNGNVATFDTNGAANTLSIGGVISGTGSVVATGGGTLTLAGNNTFGGAGQTFTAASGTVNVNNAGSFGNVNSNVIIDGVTLDNTAAAALTINNTNGMVWDGDIVFTGTNALGLGAGAVAFGGNRTLTLNSAANALTLGGVLAGNGSLTLAGAGTFLSGVLVNQGGIVTSSTGGLNVASPTGFTYQATISGTGPLTYTNTAGGTLTLQGTNNSYAGPTNIVVGTISTPLLTNGGTNSGIGSGTIINLGGATTTGTLQYTGNAGAVYSSGATTDRTINLVGPAGSGGAVDASGFGALTLTGNVSGTAAGAKTFTLTGSNFLNNTESGTISDFNTGNGDTTGLTKNGLGQWVVSGANTFSGPVSVAGGVLSVNSINSVATSPALGTVHSASSALGAPTTAVNGLISLGATSAAILRYTGAGETTDRALFMAGSTSAVTLDASGTGPLAFTKGVTAATNSKTLTLTGTNTGANAIEGLIGSASSNAISLVKYGPGNWTLTGSGSTYAGGTAINQGTLTVLDGLNGNDNGTQTSLGAGTVAVNLGGTLAFTGASDANSLLSITAALTLGGGNITITPGNGYTATINASTYVRTPGTGGTLATTANFVGATPTLLAGITTISGPNLGGVLGDNSGLGTSTAQVIFNTPPTVTGLGTSSATVLPGVLGVDTTSNAKSFVTYESTVGGVRLLKSSEQAVVYTGATSATNVRLDLVGPTAITGVTTQTLQLNNTNGTATPYTVTNTGAGLNPASGLLFSGNAPITLTGGAFQTTTTATAAEAIIMSTSTALTTISSTIQTSSATNTAGGNLSIGGTGDILLTNRPILGTTAFAVYDGTGTLTLPGVATSGGAGGIEVVNGTVRIGNAVNTPITTTSNFGAVNLSVGAGGTLDFNYGGTAFNVATSTTMFSPQNITGVNGTYGTITNLGNSLVGLQINSNNTNIGGAQTLFAGTIGGNIAMVSSGNGSTTPGALFGTNTYTGGTYITNGSGFVINSDSSLGAVPATPTNNIFITATTGGRLLAANTITLNPNRSINVVSGGVITPAAATGSILTIPGVINGAGGVSAGSGALFSSNPVSTAAVSGAGVVVLSGANTYTGPTLISAGFLSFSSIGMVGGTTPTNLGEPSSAANAVINLGNGNAGTGVGMRYTGPTVTTDRPININNTDQFFTQIGPSLDASGSGPITFTGGAFSTYAFTKTFVLTGLNTGMNTLSGGIADYSPAFPTSISKMGIGTWVINGPTTYTGVTNALGGTLYVNGSGALATTSTINITNGGTLLLSGAATGNNRINNTAPVIMGPNGTINGTTYVGGGTFGRGGTANVLEGTGASVALGGVSGTNTPGMGALTLTANSNLDFGSTASSPGVSSNGVATFVFSSYTPNGKVLNILNYVSNSYYPYGISGTDGTDDRLIFASDQLANLGDFTFGVGGSAKEISLGGGYYEIVPALSQVPEPGTWLAGALSVLTLGWSQRRRMRSLLGRTARI